MSHFSKWCLAHFILSWWHEPQGTFSGNRFTYQYRMLCYMSGLTTPYVGKQESHLVVNNKRHKCDSWDVLTMSEISNYIRLHKIISSQFILPTILSYFILLYLSSLHSSMRVGRILIAITALLSAHVRGQEDEVGSLMWPCTHSYRIVRNTYIPLQDLIYNTW